MMKSVVLILHLGMAIAGLESIHTTERSGIISFDLGGMAALGDGDCVPRWAAELAKRNNAETNSYMDFMTSYDELNSFARKVESELEQKKKELLYIQHTGNNLQLGNGRGIAEIRIFPIRSMFPIR